MAEMITTGVWVVSEAKQVAFVEAWAGFASWASAMDGAAMLRLGRDGADSTRFVSFGPWASAEKVHAWKANTEFGQRMDQVMQHADEFHPSELNVVASASDGLSSLSTVTTND